MAKTCQQSKPDHHSDLLGLSSLLLPQNWHKNSNFLGLFTFNKQIKYKYALFSPKTTTRVIDNVSHTSIPAADPRTIGHYNRSVYGMFCPAIPWQLTLSLRPTLNISVFPNLFIFISFHFLN